MNSSVSKNRGFSLLEFVAVLALASGLLLTYSQVQSLQHRQQLQGHLLATVEAAKVALYQFYETHHNFPKALQEVLSPEQVLTPWQSSLFLEKDQDRLLLVTPTPNDKVQAWLLARLVQSEVTASGVAVPIPKPIQALTTDFALHRVAVPNKPELNTMSVDLNMGGNNLLEFDQLAVNAATVEQIEADMAFVTQLDVEALNASMLTVDTATFQYVQSLLLEAEQVSVTHGVLGEVEVGTLLVNDLAADTAQAHTLQVEQLQAEYLTVDSLAVGSIQATDVITPEGSLVDAQQRLQSLELAWMECRAAGGCQ